MVCQRLLCSDSVSGVGGSADGPVGDPEHATCAAANSDTKIINVAAPARRFVNMGLVETSKYSSGTRLA